MAPKKVNLQWIGNKSIRRAAFRKRQASLVKMASDLTTLCGIKACVVVYGEGKSQPEVWPSVPEAKQLIHHFNAMPDNLGSCKKTLNQEDFLRNRISNLHYQMSKFDHENYEYETLFLLHKTMAGHQTNLAGLTNQDLISIKCMVEAKTKKIKERLQQLDIKKGQILQEPLVHPLLFSSQQQGDPMYMERYIPMLTKEPQLKQHDFLPRHA